MDPRDSHELMIALRWPGGRVVCPHCGSEKVTWLERRSCWKCYGGHAKAKFSLKTGTIFEDSAVPLEKWVAAVAGVMGGVSSWELHRRLSVTQKTAWFMLHRIRLAVWEAGVGVELEGCSLEEVMRRVLRVSKAELDRRVEEARATSPRVGDENAPGRKKFSRR